MGVAAQMLSQLQRVLQWLLLQKLLISKVFALAFSLQQSFHFSLSHPRCLARSASREHFGTNDTAFSSVKTYSSNQLTLLTPKPHTLPSLCKNICAQEKLTATLLCSTLPFCSLSSRFGDELRI